MYSLLKENSDILQNFEMINEPYRVGNTSTNRGKVINWGSTKEALKRISEVPLIKDTCFLFLENEYFANINDSFYIPYEVYLELHPEYEKLMTCVEAIIDFFEAAEFEQIESGFDIKMPQTEDFSEFAKNIELLDKAISQCPYLNNNDEKIVLKKTDIGSIWFEFAVITSGGIVILSNLSKIIDKCIKIKSHYITVKQQEEKLRQLKLQGDVIETVVNAYKKSTDELINQCVAELNKEIPDVSIDNESKGRVKYTLENLSKLMEKGMEIYASIDSSQEVKDLFPTSDEMKFFPKPQALLEDGEEE